jgi:hypothetical protein
MVLHQSQCPAPAYRSCIGDDDFLVEIVRPLGVQLFHPILEFACCVPDVVTDLECGDNNYSNWDDFLVVSLSMYATTEHQDNTNNNSAYFTYQSHLTLTIIY